jgi:hypothetical protein
VRGESSTTQFLGGAVAGLALALGSIVLGFLVVIGSVVAIVVAGLILPRFSFLAGGLIGLGATWLAIMVLAQTNGGDLGPSGFEYFPGWVIGTLILIGFGVTFAVLGYRRAG